MLANLFNISTNQVSNKLFAIFGGIILLSILMGVATEFYALAVLPVMVMVGFIAVVDFKFLFFLSLILIPFSIEMTLPGGIGTDFPSEGLVVGLMMIFLLYFLKNLKNINSGFYKHQSFGMCLSSISWQDS